jgi:hypothetical protein
MWISNRPQEARQPDHLRMERFTAEPKSEMATMTPKATKYEISRLMAAMGHRGGEIGGKMSLLTMTSEEHR